MKSFRTLRGFIEGKEPDEETYFACSATLRIFGDIQDIDEISHRLGFKPTHAHRKGECKGPGSSGFRNDMWAYEVPLSEGEPLEKHIDMLWSKIKAHKTYLLELKKDLHVDIFLGYRSNCDHAGIRVSHTSLEMFMELKIPFSVSIIIT